MRVRTTVVGLPACFWCSCVCAVANGSSSAVRMNKRVHACTHTRTHAHTTHLLDSGGIHLLKRLSSSVWGVGYCAGRWGTAPTLAAIRAAPLAAEAAAGEAEEVRGSPAAATRGRAESIGLRLAIGVP